MDSALVKELMAGLAFHKAGQFQQAEAAYRKILQVDPRHPDALHYLGLLARQAAKLDVAAELISKAIEIRPSSQMHFHLGIVFQAQDKLDQAIECFHRAIALKPDYAQAHCQMAIAQIVLGQFEAAQAALSKVPESDPELPLAWALLAWSRKMTPQDGGWLNTALKLLSNAALPGKQRCTLQFALGKYYDDNKQYDLAFSAYRQVNDLQRKLEGGFDREAHSRLVDAVIAAWPAGFVSGAPEAASPSRLPVLVVGMMRSGTTLTEQIIASHPEAAGAGELSFWQQQFALNQAALLAGNHGAQLVSQLAQGYEQALRRVSAAAARIVDKMPHNFIHLGLIHEVFPQAKIIHVRRNPVDTCLSIYFQYMSTVVSFATDLDDIAFFYREYVRLMAHWRKVLPAHSLMEISYEDLIRDPPAWSRKIIEFIGLDWDEHCLDFHQTERRVGTPSNWQVRQPIYQTSKARWRNYEKHLGPLLELLDNEDT